MPINVGFSGTRHGMNEKQKFVVSHQTFDPGWERVTVLSANGIEQVKQIKAQPGQTLSSSAATIYA